MNRLELIQKVEFLVGDGHKELHLYGFTKAEDKIYKINISPALETQLIEVVTSGVKTHLIDKEYDILSFSTAESRQNCYFHYDLEEMPERMVQVPYIIGNHHVPTFNLHQHSVEELNTLVILITDGNGHSFALYKIISAVEKVVKSTKQVLVKFGIGEEFLTEEDTPLLRISPRFQMIYVDGAYIFLDSSSVEGQFKFHQLLNNEAARKIEVIGRTGLLKDVNKLRQYADNIAFSRKLVGVMRSSLVIEMNISKTDILNFIQEDDELKDVFKIVQVENEDFIDINSQLTARRFLDLLNDEFLVSTLTKQKYHALDKQQRRPKE